MIVTHCINQRQLGWMVGSIFHLPCRIIVKYPLLCQFEKKNIKSKKHFSPKIQKKHFKKCYQTPFIFWHYSRKTDSNIFTQEEKGEENLN